MAAEAVLPQEISVVSKLIKQSSAADELEPFLADAQINLGSIQTILHRGGDSTQLVRSGLANWRELVKKNQNSSTVLDDAAQDFLFAEPATLKDTKLAVACAERAVMLSRRKLPTKLLTLAQAYRAAGQFEKSRAAAKEGLALLPAPQPASVKPRMRRLLEIQAESRF
jgi:tetratricopeptide (TPR) repeat protein